MKGYIHVLFGLFVLVIFLFSLGWVLNEANKVIDDAKGKNPSLIPFIILYYFILAIILFLLVAFILILLWGG
jgi:ABC-type Na+ efflux pump permease subunit